MNSIVLDEIPFKIELADVAGHLNIDADSDDYEIFAGLLEKARNIARPKALYRVSAVEVKGADDVIIDDIPFKSNILKINIENVSRVFPFVVTCGTEIDEWSLTVTDLLENYWVDRIKEMILGCAESYLRGHIKEIFQIKSLSAMNPGSLEDWPLSEQQSLFRVLGNVHESIGVELSGSYLMKPIKSVSGIYFQTETQYENCQLCPRQSCPNRRMPYDENMLHGKYAKNTIS